LLDRIKANPRRAVLQQRVRLSALRKGAIAVRAKWLARFTRRRPVGQRGAGVESASA
jgi:hypothetical protein